MTQMFLGCGILSKQESNQHESGTKPRFLSQKILFTAIFRFLSLLHDEKFEKRLRIIVNIVSLNEARSLSNYSATEKF